MHLPHALQQGVEGLAQGLLGNPGTALQHLLHAGAAGYIAPDQLDRLRTPPAPDQPRPIRLKAIGKIKRQQRIIQLADEFRLLGQHLAGEIGDQGQTAYFFPFAAVQTAPLENLREMWR